MSTLICVLGSGKGSWGHITRLISDGNWKSIYLISNDWGKEKFNPNKTVNWITINTNMGFDLMAKTIKDSLPNDSDIVTNFLSGDGKVHMATVQALREKYSNFKLAILTKDGLQYY
jgi:hypothetical protein